MSAPAAPAAPDSGKSSTAWIIAFSVAVLIAIGFAVWGFTTNSDLDKANRTIKTQNATITTQQAAIAAASVKEKTAVGIEDQQVKEYSRTRKKLSGAKLSEAQQKQEIATQKAQVVTAQQQLAAANTQQQKLVAEANLAKQQLDVAQACTRGTIRAIDSVFTAGSAQQGIDRLNRDLAKLSQDCNETVG